MKLLTSSGSWRPMGMSPERSHGFSREGRTGRSNASELRFGCSESGCRGSLQVQKRSLEFASIKMAPFEAAADGRLSLPLGDSPV